MNIRQIREFPFGCKGLKTYRGHEGEPLRQATLTLNGEKIGFISEGDWGGPPTLDVAKEHRQTVDGFIKAQGTVTTTIQVSDTRKETFQHAYNEEDFVSDALMFAQTAKKIEALRRKNTICFVLPGDEPDMYRTVKGGSHPIERVIDHIKSKYPSAEILQPTSMETK